MCICGRTPKRVLETDLSRFHPIVHAIVISAPRSDTINFRLLLSDKQTDRYLIFNAQLTMDAEPKNCFQYSFVVVGRTGH